MGNFVQNKEMKNPVVTEALDIFKTPQFYTNK